MPERALRTWARLLIPEERKSCDFRPLKSFRVNT
jgi:hypothetical protein